MKRPRLFAGRRAKRDGGPDGAEAAAGQDAAGAPPSLDAVGGEVAPPPAAADPAPAGPLDPAPAGPTTREGVAPRRRRWVGIVQIAAVLALVVVALVFSRDRGGGAPPDGGESAVAASAAVPLVTVVLPRVETAVVKVEATGTVTARSFIALTPQVGGRVVEVSDALRAGGAFEANETLLVIDPQDFLLALNQAKADVAGALADLRLKRAESEAARSNFALLHPGEPVPPLVARLPQIAQSEARLMAARARQAIAALDLSRTRFSLPFAGKVAETTAELGQTLTKNQPFGQAFAFEALEVTVPIGQGELRRLAPAAGRRATVASGGMTFAATVERVSAELDARTRFARLYLSIGGDRASIPPGTFVDVVVQGPTLRDVFVLPEAAEQAGGHVWRVERDRLARQDIDILGRSPNALQVAAFDPGQGVVVGAAPGGRDGLAVRVLGESPARPTGIAGP